MKKFSGLFSNYDANLTTVITQRSDPAVYDRFTCNVNFPVCRHKLWGKCTCLNSGYVPVRPIILFKKRLRHSPVNFPKCLGKPFSQNTSSWLLLKLDGPQHSLVINGFPDVSLFLQYLYKITAISPQVSKFSMLL